VRFQASGGGRSLTAAAAIPFSLDALFRYRNLAPRAEVARDPAAVMSYTSFRGYYWSLLMGARFPHESLLECHSMIIHDLDPTVEFLRAQPVTIRCQFEGKSFRYTPDLHVRFVDGAEYFLEVKTTEQYKKLTDRRLRGMAFASASHGVPHALLFEGGDPEQVDQDGRQKPGVYDQPLFSNSLRARAAPAFLTDAAIIDIADALAKTGLPCPLGTLCRAMSGNVRVEIVLGLVALRVLTIPLSADITAASIVSHGSEW
jgi:hypothetical protein